MIVVVTMVTKSELVKHTKLYLDAMRCMCERETIILLIVVIHVVEFRKGDIESAVKFLELYVEVAEGIESKETVAKAYCSAGIMFNFLVSNNYYMYMYIYMQANYYIAVVYAHVFLFIV